MKKTILAALALCQCLCIANAQDVNPFGKALVPDMIADASIILVDGTFYCYATIDGTALPLTFAFVFVVVFFKFSIFYGTKKSTQACFASLITHN